MSNSINVGYVTPAGQDVLPTTAPHLDVRVLKDGKYVDPGTIRSLLTRLKIGKEKKPLWQQKGEQWTPSFPITSGFGKRKAPTAGASTYHPAHDYGVAGGTALTWEGPGSFIPGKGFGTIKTTDVQGTPYEIKLLHTKSGKSAEIAGQPTAVQMPQVEQKGDTFIYVPRRKKEDTTEPDDFLASYIQQSLMGGTPKITSAFDPVGMLTQAFSQTPPLYT